MPDSFKIDLTQLAALSSRLQDVPDKLIILIDQELSDGAQSIAAEAIQRAPGDQSFLRQGIGTEKLAMMQYSVFSLALYSAYLEFGTRANVSVPEGLEEYAAQFMGSTGTSAKEAKEAIFAWCERKGIDPDAWYIIYITIMTRGGQPHPFFFPAVNRILPIIVNRITKILVNDAFK